MDIKALHKEGHSIKQIARHTGFSRNTVRRVLREAAPADLGLSVAQQPLDQAAQQAAANGWYYTHFLGYLLEAETRFRHDKKAFADWAEVFAADPIMASAALDRLLHRSTVVHSRGDSCRLKEKRQAKSQPLEGRRSNHAELRHPFAIAPEPGAILDDRKGSVFSEC